MGEDPQNVSATSEKTSEIIHANHFVPRGLLKRWCNDGLRIPTYNLVVPHPRYPTWTSRPISKVAMQKDLYTTIEGGEETDHAERWFARIEHEGLEASERLIEGARPTRDEWHAMIRFYALQDVRTPQSFVESMRRWDKELPETIEKVLASSIAELAQAKAQGRMLEPQKDEGHPFSGTFQISIHPPSERGGDATVQASVIAGRRFWIATIYHVLGGKAMDRLLRHTWSILKPAAGLEWPLTDHPAIKLSYRSASDFNFHAGWAQRRADLMMPLSPHHLLYVQVGSNVRGVRTLSYETTTQLQKMIVNRASRHIFARRPSEWISKARPRTVNRSLYDDERAAWERWHPEQSQAESRRAQP